MRNFLLFLFAVMFINIAFSQRNSVQLGIKAGVNIADFNDDLVTQDSRIGFHGGLLVHVHVKPQLAIQPELVYSQQGAEFSTGKQKLDYLNIPFLIQYLFNGGFRLQTGPQIGVLVNSEFKDNNGVEIDNGKNFKKSDVGWVFGLGYLSPTGLGVDARYNLGLTDVTKGGADVQNRVWQFGIFYQFRR
jgi:hypothetical protein